VAGVAPHPGDGPAPAAPAGGARPRHRAHARLDLLPAPGVEVDVIHLHVRDHGDVRLQQEEGAVTLVRLRDEDVAGPVARTRPRLVEVPTDHEGWGPTDGPEDHRDHRGGGGLPVRAGHGDRRAAAHQRGKDLGTHEHGDPRLTCTAKLRVDGRDGGGDHHRIGRADLGVVVPHVHRRTGLLEPAERSGVLQVRPGDVHPAGQEQAGDPAHARAAGPDQMKPSPRRRVRNVERGNGAGPGNVPPRGGGGGGRAAFRWPGRAQRQRRLTRLHRPPPRRDRPGPPLLWDARTRWSAPPWR
jgi:hypothetical protein